MIAIPCTTGVERILKDGKFESSDEIEAMIQAMTNNLTFDNAQSVFCT
jgi:hypothetical protein